MSSFTSNNSNILEDDKISWEKSSYNSIDMNDYEEEYGDIPVLDFNTPKNNYLENTDHYIKKKINTDITIYIKKDLISLY